MKNTILFPMKKKSFVWRLYHFFQLTLITSIGDIKCDQQWLPAKDSGSKMQSSEDNLISEKNL